MNRSQIITLYDQDQRRDIEYPDMRREVTPEVVRLIDTSDAREGAIIYSRLTDTNAPEVIHEQINYFKSIRQNFEWKVYDYDRPPDLKERLAACGFVVEEAEAIMVLDLEEAPEILWQRVRHHVQPITQPDKLAEVLSVQQQVWDEDFSGLGHFLETALRRYPEHMSVYVAYIDAQPASAAWVYFPKHSRFASLWGGSTISRFRKQGLYTALLTVRAQEARAREVRYLTVDASDMSRPILEKFGFEVIAYSHPCKWNFQIANQTKDARPPGA